MQHKLVKTIYPDSSGLLITDVKPPKDLEDYINKLEGVMRFDDERYHINDLLLITPKITQSGAFIERQQFLTKMKP